MYLTYAQQTNAQYCDLERLSGVHCFALHHHRALGRLSGLPRKAADEEKSLEYQSAGMGTVRVQAYSTQYTL